MWIIAWLLFCSLGSSLRSRAALQAEILSLRHQLEEILSAPHSPWQNAYVERLIGSIRRECLDHVMIFSEQGLRRVLRLYCEYYEKSRTHLGLAKDAPISRPIQPPSLGKVIELPQVGGLHHRYERRAA